MILEAVDERPLRAPLVRRHRPEGLEQPRDRAVAPERCDAHRFERSLVGGRGDVGGEVTFE